MSKVTMSFHTMGLVHYCGLIIVKFIKLVFLLDFASISKEFLPSLQYLSSLYYLQYTTD